MAILNWNYICHSSANKSFRTRLPYGAHRSQCRRHRWLPLWFVGRAAGQLRQTKALALSILGIDRSVAGAAVMYACNNNLGLEMPIHFTVRACECQGRVRVSEPWSSTAVGLHPGRNKPQPCQAHNFIILRRTEISGSGSHLSSHMSCVQAPDEL